MRKSLIFGLVFLLATALIPVSSAYEHNYNSGHFSYNYNSYQNRAVFTLRFDDDNFRSFFDGKKSKRKTANFLLNSARERYRVTSGKTTGEAFYYDDESATLPASNWRNKVAYNPKRDGIDSDYYKPKFDSNLGYYNWRF